MKLEKFIEEYPNDAKIVFEFEARDPEEQFQNVHMLMVGYRRLEKRVEELENQINNIK